MDTQLTYIKKRSDRLMDYFLATYFLTGLLFAFWYDTWLIAVGVGGICLVAYYSVKAALPKSDLYQYVLSVAVGIFMAQYIYQTHGLFEMHFFAFIGSAILVTYQNWKLQIPALIVVFFHHLLFSYLQNAGIHGLYFTKLEYFDVQTFVIHILLTVAIFFICGLWAYQLKKYQDVQIIQALKMADLEQEALLAIERERSATILGRLNEDLQQQTTKLQASNAELEQFAYTVSHDLQEPLRMVTGFLGLLERKYVGQIDEKGKEYIDFAVNACGQMRQLISDLLEFSRVGRSDEKNEAVDLNQLLTVIQALYSGMFAEDEPIFQFAPLPVVEAPRALLRQVFQNLIGNGIKYQPPGQKPVICVDVKEIPGFWEFSISDNGIGIAKEFREQVFLLFKRLHDRETYPGTGIGLAITRKIIENMGGKINMLSQPGVGSTFYFTIPKHTNG